MPAKKIGYIGSNVEGEWGMHLFEKPPEAQMLIRTLETHKLGKVYDEVWETFEDDDGTEKLIRIVSSVEQKSETEILQEKINELESRILAVENK